LKLVIGIVRPEKGNDVLEALADGDVTSVVRHLVPSDGQDDATPAAA
jgi:nitrogen regulatory protein PII